MATQNETRPGMQQVGIIALIVAAIVLVGYFAAMARHYTAPQGPSTAQIMQGHKIPDWVTQDAIQCKGDISKLSPQEQQKLNAAYPNGTARFVLMAASNMSR